LPPDTRTCFTDSAPEPPRQRRDGGGMGKLTVAGRPKLRHRILALVEAVSPFADEPAAAPTDGAWRWLFADDAGVAVPGPPVRFTSGEAAEKWLRSYASRLAGAGVSGITLLDGEHAVYGPTALVG
jgi:hypothetical protein